MRRLGDVFLLEHHSSSRIEQFQRHLIVRDDRVKGKHHDGILVNLFAHALHIVVIAVAAVQEIDLERVRAFDARGERRHEQRDDRDARDDDHHRDDRARTSAAMTDRGAR